MWRAFGQMPAALDASVEIAERCSFRLPLARSSPSGPSQRRLGPELLFGLAPARQVSEQQLQELVEEALPLRFAETGRGKLTDEVLERARDEVQTICSSGLADLLLFSHEVGRWCCRAWDPDRGTRVGDVQSGRMGARALRHLPDRPRPRRPHVRPRGPGGPARPGSGGVVVARGRGIGNRAAAGHR